LPLGAAFVLAVNDHVLKHAHVLPGWLTGKLSDVSGLFFFPVLLFAIASAALGTPRSRGLRAAVLAALTAAVFTLIKIDATANALATALLGEVVRDPSDLLALPMVVASAWYLRRAPAAAVGPSRCRRLVGHVAVLLAAVASLATSAPRQARNYPSWEVRGATFQRAGCAEIGVTVVKSGKTGFGVVLTRGGEEACVVKVVAARLRVGRREVAPASIPAWDGERTMYVAFAFDSEGFWNDGIRAGTLELEVEAAGQRAAIVFALEHVWTGPHRDTRLTAPPPAPPAPPPPPPAPESVEP
jgi:hypothetical protein